MQPSRVVFRKSLPNIQLRFWNPAQFALLAIALLLLLPSVQAQQFPEAISSPVGSNSYIVSADFNNDGKMDVAMAGQFNDDLTIIVALGKGNGTFVQSALYDGYFATAIAVTDLNGDGKPDLIVGTSGAPSFAVVFIGRGDGTFNRPVTYVTGSGTDYLGVGDFNHDGKTDLVACNWSDATATGNVTILLGNGDGTLRPPRAFTVGHEPSAVSVADVNNDHNLDLVVANRQDNTVSVLLGNGDGTFQPQKVLKVDTGPISLAAADFNNDGNVDFAVLCAGSNDASVFLGDGTGNFQFRQSYPFLPFATQIVSADFNLDGNADLAISDELGITMLWGQGTGNFTTANFSVVDPLGIATGDFNGDGRPDVVAAALGAEQSRLVSVLLTNTNNTLEAPQAFTVPFESGGTVQGDFNGDGNLDIAVGGFSLTGDDDVAILLGDGHGNLSTFSSYKVGTSAGVAATGDFNHDGKLDLALIADINNNDNGVFIMLGNGDGTFQSPTSYTFFNVTGAVVMGDFNKDGNLDLAVVAGSSVGILLGNGDGSFRSGGSFSPNQSPGDIATADFNGDGILDLAVVQDQEIDIFLGNGDGTFHPGSQNAEPNAPGAITVGDFNRDGRADFAVVDAGYGTFFVFLGNGNGTFVQTGPYGDNGVFASAIAVGDFNGDGKQDLVFNAVDLHSPGFLNVAYGNGDGTFKNAINYNASDTPEFIAVGDFNNDGADDLLASYSQFISLSLNLGGTYLNLASAPNPSKVGQLVTFAVRVRPSVTAVTKPPAITGHVTFYDGRNVMCSDISLNAGIAKCGSYLSAGTHSIRALYKSNDYNPHLSHVYKQIVKP